MAKQRGRQRKSVDEIKSVWAKAKDSFDIGGLELVLDKQTGRAGLYERTGEGEFEAVVSNVSGNTLVDSLRIMGVLGSRAKKLPDGGKVAPVDLADSDE